MSCVFAHKFLSFGKTFFMKISCRYLPFLLLFVLYDTAKLKAQDNGKIRIIMIGAHPDDCDQEGGGTAILFARMGYAVKFVSVTNGDAGHQVMKGKELAERR